MIEEVGELVVYRAMFDIYCVKYSRDRVIVLGDDGEGILRR